MRTFLHTLRLPTAARNLTPQATAMATRYYYSLGISPTSTLLASAAPSVAASFHPVVGTTTAALPSASSTPPPSSSVSAAAALYKSSRSRGRGLPPSNKNAVPMSQSKQALPTLSSASPVLAGSAAADISCATELPAETRPLTALQKRQLAMKDKKVFTLTSRAVDRVNMLLRLHNDQVDTASTNRPQADKNEVSIVNEGSTKLQRAVGIRIGVKKKGCSGYSYTVNYEFDESKLKLKTGGDALVDAMINSTRAPAATNTSSSNNKSAALTDVHVDQDGVHIFVEGQALFYVIGTVMDYSVSNVEEKFTFQNPNQAHSCGCGESFMPFGV